MEEIGVAAAAAYELLMIALLDDPASGQDCSVAAVDPNRPLVR
ncbi:hypothetical protein [Microbispora sp. H11081]|nr:hypothetical protein [Microbispora sp. H11081]